VLSVTWLAIMNANLSLGRVVCLSHIVPIWEKWIATSSLVVKVSAGVSNVSCICA
jgi:hypothetical protein